MIIFNENEYNQLKQHLHDNVQFLLAKPSVINHSNTNSTINKVELVLNLNNDVIIKK